LLRILVVDDDATARRSLERFLTQIGHTVTLASDGNDALLAVASEHPQLVLTDIYMPGMTGLDLQAKIRELDPATTLIVMTGRDDMPTTVRAMQQGAYDYLTKPIDLERLEKLLQHVERSMDLSEKLSTIVDERAKDYLFENVLIGRTPSMMEIYKTIGSITNSKVTVLITGESGTGKELIVRAIHFNSPWKSEPFIAVNCTALTESLLESELFGHTKGSFTGAIADKKGKFELAREGTIFLDEIGEISPKIQVMLLRVLQERVFERVGGNQTIPMQARIVAATNRDLDEEVRKGRFREDLFYRLNVVSIHVPPLRERKDDIPILVQHLLGRINAALHTNVKKVSGSAMKTILEHSWPGNVRELENILTRAVVLAKDEWLDESVLPNPDAIRPSDSAAPYNWKRSLAEVEKEHIAAVLTAVGGNRTEAARILGISKPTLYAKLPTKEAKKEG
jgi:DNA-binding NtrC family response regulator